MAGKDFQKGVLVPRQAWSLRPQLNHHTQETAGQQALMKVFLRHGQEGVNIERLFKGDRTGSCLIISQHQIPNQKTTV